MATDTVAIQQQFALGLGLTNECNLACSFCYRDPARLDRISLEQVQRILAALPVRSVNLGTGENGMHPDFHNIIGWLKDQPLRMTMTSNGHSVELLTDEELSFFSDIEFSLDYDNRAQQDGQRGRRKLGSGASPGRAMPPGRGAGYHHRGHDEVELQKPGERGPHRQALRRTAADQCLSVGPHRSLRAHYNEYWEGFRLLLEQTDLISTGSR